MYLHLSSYLFICTESRYTFILEGELIQIFIFVFQPNRKVSKSVKLLNLHDIGVQFYR